MVYGVGVTTSSAPVARIALESGIDDFYSAAFLINGFPELIGIDRNFYKRAGTQVVNQRVRKLGIDVGGKTTYGEILQKRSTLRLSIDALEKDEERGEKKSDEKLQSRRSELTAVEKILEAIPFRVLQPFEVAQQLDEFLSKAKHKLLITTSMPRPSKCSTMTFLFLEQALKRGVQVEILIADRPEAGFLESKNGRWRALKRLSEFSARYSNLQVGFLKETSRMIFEMMCDESRLLVTNEPPLGERPLQQLVRHFTGHLILGKTQADAYAIEFFGPDALSVVQRLKYQKAIERSIPRKIPMRQPKNLK